MARDSGEHIVLADSVPCTCVNLATGQKFCDLDNCPLRHDVDGLRSWIVDEDEQECLTWRCPKCGSDALEVKVEVWARLNQHTDGNFETATDESQDGSHEWGENTPMQCVVCGHSDIADAFVVNPNPSRPIWDGKSSGGGTFERGE